MLHILEINFSIHINIYTYIYNKVTEECWHQILRLVCFVYVPQTKWFCGVKMLSSQSAMSLDITTIRASVKIYIKCSKEKVTLCSGLNDSYYMQAWTTTVVDTWQWGEKDLTKKSEYMKIRYIYTKHISFHWCALHMQNLSSVEKFNICLGLLWLIYLEVSQHVILFEKW